MGVVSRRWVWDCGWNLWVWLVGGCAGKEVCDRALGKSAILISRYRP